MSEKKGPNAARVGEIAAENLGPLLYALEVCAVSMEKAARAEDAKYYRSLASRLAEAGGSPRDD